MTLDLEQVGAAIDGAVRRFESLPRALDETIGVCLEAHQALAEACRPMFEWAEANGPEAQAMVKPLRERLSRHDLTPDPSDEMLRQASTRHRCSHV